MSDMERIDRSPGRSAALTAAAAVSQRSAGLTESKTVELRSDRSEAPQLTPAPAEAPEHPAETISGPGNPQPAKRSQRLRWALSSSRRPPIAAMATRS
jgi:hypothetical protein